MAEEISKIRCGTNGECHNIKDATAREGITSLEDSVRVLENIVKGITGGSLDEYITEAEMTTIINDVNAAITAAVGAAKEEANAAKEEANATTQQKVTAEATARANADTNLQSQIDSLNTGMNVIDNHLTQVQTSVNTEITNRENADASLLTEIGKKVDQTALAEIESTINGKAAQSDLDSINESVTTLQSQIADVTNIVTVGTNYNYLKFTNGVLICWGGMGALNNETLSIVFPTAFSKEPMVTTAPVSNDGVSGNSKTWEHGMIFNVSTTKFSFYSCDNFGIKYIAIGRWK